MQKSDAIEDVKKNSPINEVRPTPFKIEIVEAAFLISSPDACGHLS